MHLIHPSHVPVVNQVFTPTKEEIAHWQGLIQAMEQLSLTGYSMDGLDGTNTPRQSLLPQGHHQAYAAVTFDGDMVDVAHEETARSMLKLVKQWGILS